MNKVILSGNLCRDNELRRLQTGTAVLNNTIAVRREVKNETGEYESDFINIVLFGQNAEYINEYAKKGSKIELSGRWQHRKYQDNQGNTKYVDECIVESASLLQSTKQQEDATQPTQPQQPKQQEPTYNPFDFDDSDLPF